MIKSKMASLLFLATTISFTTTTYAQEPIPAKPLPEIDHNQVLKESMRHKYGADNHSKRKFFKKGKFWVFVAGIGGAVAGAVLASTASNNAPNLKLKPKYDPRGPISKE